MMNQRFVSWSLQDLIPGEPLPVTCYLYLGHKFILYRSEGDFIDHTTYDRMDMKGIRNIFIRREDETAMESWLSKGKDVKPQDLPISKKLHQVRAGAERCIMDIFHSTHSNEIISKTLKTSEKLVTELMKFPFASKPLTQLQSFSRGTIDHSVNVSVLCVYLAMNMGYSHVLILRHLAAGALLHDCGKAKVILDENLSEAEVEEKLKKHPDLAYQLLNEDDSISKEVKMIVMQHHEYDDGSGFPKGLRGKDIYDLARIVNIANHFDHLVSESRGTLDERQNYAISQLSGPLAKRFDSNKLTKALKILTLGI